MADSEDTQVTAAQEATPEAETAEAGAVHEEAIEETGEEAERKEPPSVQDEEGARPVVTEEAIEIEAERMEAPSVKDEEGDRPLVNEVQGATEAIEAERTEPPRGPDEAGDQPVATEEETERTEPPSLPTEGADTSVPQEDQGQPAESLGTSGAVAENADPDKEDQPSLTVAPEGQTAHVPGVDTEVVDGNAVPKDAGGSNKGTRKGGTRLAQQKENQRETLSAMRKFRMQYDGAQKRLVGTSNEDAEGNHDIWG
mmetsp:Transcript_62575/g.116380  ORF Transcript_62575/g.116380 Transcript_62575/m.116380 type:complete len:255 (+) Transcript_62575:86-850(+)